MAQTVLTNHIKEQVICNALTKAGIPKRKAALRAARIDWAERVRLAAIGGQEVEAEIIKNLKKNRNAGIKIPRSTENYQHFYQNR